MQQPQQCLSYELDIWLAAIICYLLLYATVIGHLGPVGDRVT